jgi:hypothetical protein
MVNPKLVNYIRSVEAKGFSRDQIKARLIKSNYTENDIDEAFTHADSFRIPLPKGNKVYKKSFSEKLSDFLDMLKMK